MVLSDFGFRISFGFRVSGFGFSKLLTDFSALLPPERQNQVPACSARLQVCGARDNWVVALLSHFFLCCLVAALSLMTTPPTPDRRGSWNLDSAVARVVLYTAVHPNPALAQRFPAQQPASSRSFSPTIIHSSTLHLSLIHI